MVRRFSQCAATTVLGRARQWSMASINWLGLQPRKRIRSILSSFMASAWSAGRRHSLTIAPGNAKVRCMRTHFPCLLFNNVVETDSTGEGHGTEPCPVLTPLGFLEGAFCARADLLANCASRVCTVPGQIIINLWILQFFVLRDTAGKNEYNIVLAE